MLNILAISYAKRVLEPGSRERVRMQQYAAAVTQYHVVVFTRLEEGYPAIQRDGQLTLYATNARTKLGMVYRAYQLAREILRQRPDDRFVVSSQDPFESGLVGQLVTRRSQHVQLVQLHGDLFNRASYGGSVLDRLRVWYGKRLVTRVDRLRVVSERIKRSVVSLGVSPQRVAVLPIQADLDRFIAVGRARSWHVQTATLRLLFVGRLAPEKNIFMLLEAVSLLQQRAVPVSLRIVGSGPEEGRAWSYVTQHDLTDVVTFVPWTENVEAEFAAADVFCLTSDHEGWAMVLQEAAAAGLAIVATNVGCVGEFIRHEQEGLVVPVGDTDGFAHTVARLADDALRTRLAQAAHARAAEPTTDYIDRWVATHRVS